MIRLLAVLAVLWLLLAAQIGVNAAGIPSGVMTFLILTAAIIQAGLLLFFDMRLGDGPALIRLIALGAVCWLSILFGLGLTDWLTR